MSNPNAVPPKKGGFQKGQSGNPAGRPGMPPEIRQAFRDLTMDAIKTLVEVMQNSEKGSERARAAEVILDRAWCKAPSAPEDTEAANEKRSELVEAIVALAKAKREK